MKTFRNITVLVGLSAVLFALVATGARAQTLALTSFSGTFTLPLDAQWGAMTLPAGDYSLSYGQPFKGGIHAVTVAGEAVGSPHGMILMKARSQTSASKNKLLCVREGNKLYVRTLELASIGESVHFKIPQVVEVRSKVIAKNHSPSGKTRFREVAILVHGAPAK